MRKPIIIGNWKMNQSIADSINFINELDKTTLNIDVGIAPQTISLLSLKAISKNVLIGAQTINDHLVGAYTGENSVELLEEAALDFALVGHSERRQYYNETNESVNAKAKLLLNANILPVICVGETLEEYEGKQTQNIIEQQLEVGLKDIAIEQCVIAYEPVWAIGTGRTATAQIAQDVCAMIRHKVEQMYSKEQAAQVRIQYGGSVKPDNIKELMDCPDIDGALVGGASLELESFIQLINY